MKYAILKDLKEISERRDTVKLGQLVESLNQAKDSDNTLLVERISNNRYSIEIKDNHINWDGVAYICGKIETKTNFNNSEFLL